MKVFAVKRRREEDITNKTLEKVSEVKLFNKDKFNYIVIKNPSDSNEICTIKSLKISNADGINGLCLMQGEEEKSREQEGISVRNKFGILKIESGMVKSEDNKKLQLCKSCLTNSEECNLLEDSVLILLPKGCLFIRLDNEVTKLDVNIEWTSELIG